MRVKQPVSFSISVEFAVSPLFTLVTLGRQNVLPLVFIILGGRFRWYPGHMARNFNTKIEVHVLVYVRLRFVCVP